MFAIFKIALEVGAAIFSLIRNVPIVVEKYNKNKKKKELKENK